MSAERFFAVNPPNAQTREIFIREHEEKRSRDPLVIDFAYAMIAAGSDGIESLARKYAKPSNVIERSDALFYILKREGAEDIGAVLLGSSLITLHETLITSRCDLNPFADRIQTAFRGHLNFSLSGEQARFIEQISPDRYKLMLKAAEEHKNLAIFFKNPACLPDNLREFLLTSNEMPTIRRSLEKYDPTAALLAA